MNYYDEVVVNNTTGVVEGFHYDIGQQLQVERAFLPNASDNLSALVDGDESTSWTNGNNANKTSIQWDLGSEKTVKALKLMPLNPLNWTFIVDVYVGDGANWTKVFPNGNASPIVPMMAWPAPLHVDPAVGRYVRMDLKQTWSNASSANGIKNTIGFFETEIWGETAHAGLELDENFDGQALGAAPDGWQIVESGAGASATLANAPGTGSPSVRLLDASATSRIQISKPFIRQKGSMVVVEADYFPVAIGSGEYLRLFDGGTIALDLVNSETAGGLAQTNNSWTQSKVADLNPGQWHHLRIEINTDLDSYDLYVDNALVGQRDGRRRRRLLRQPDRRRADALRRAARARPASSRTRDRQPPA